jgi:hypothetical protein
MHKGSGTRQGVAHRASRLKYANTTLLSSMFLTGAMGSHWSP